MSFTSSLQSFLFGSQYVGIEHFSFETEEKVALLELERKKNELTITKEDLRIFKDSFLKSLDKKKPYHLVINSNQVIQKEIEETDGSDNKLLNKAFPNIKWEDFYYEIWRLQNKSVICISRKSYVDELLLNYKKEQISVTHISLGNCSISSILTVSKHDKLETNKHILTFDDAKEMSSSRDKKTPAHYDINGLNISNTHLLSFSVVLQSILNGKLTTGNLTNLNFSLHDTYFQKQFFYRGIQIGVGVLLTILLLNFFVFTNYYKKVQENSQALLLNHSSQETLVKLKERITLKEESVEKIYGKEWTSSTIILNEITKHVPTSILLSELTYQPLEKKIKDGEPILVENKILHISGTTINTEAFTIWIESLEKLNFIDQVIITHFGKNENSETVFSLKLSIHETK